MEVGGLGKGRRHKPSPGIFSEGEQELFNIRTEEFQGQIRQMAGLKAHYCTQLRIYEINQ